MNDKEVIRLLMFPYAGGSGLYYSHWSKYLDNHIKMIPIELPGRGLRFKEPLCDDMNETIEHIWDSVKVEIVQGKYALFGYCVGTLIVYELFKRIRQENLPEPSHCFLCAHPAPDVPRKGKAMSENTEEELIDEWIRGSRISRGELEKKSYLKSVYEVWKTDCAMIDKYCFKGEKEKFNCNITLVNGRQETLFTQAEQESWRLFCTAECKNILVDGAHDFMKTNEKALIDIINIEI